MALSCCYDNDLFFANLQLSPYRSFICERHGKRTPPMHIQNVFQVDVQVTEVIAIEHQGIAVQSDDVTLDPLKGI